MGSVEVGEAANFLIDLLILPAIAIVLRKGLVPRADILIAASAFLVLSHASTIAEGFALGGFFDAVEHLSAFASSIFFAAFFLSASRAAGAGGIGRKGGPGARR